MKKYNRLKNIAMGLIILLTSFTTLFFIEKKNESKTIRYTHNSSP